MLELLLQNGTGVREWKVRSHTYIFVAGCSRTDLLCNVMGWGWRAGQHVHVWLAHPQTNSPLTFTATHTQTNTEHGEWWRARRQFPSRSSRGSSSTIVLTGSRPRALDWGVCVLVSMCMHLPFQESIVTVWCTFPFILALCTHFLYTWI